ncbi:MAG: hypothetical protein ABEJ89_01230 [Haloarculaceae archaeon]
MSAAGLCALCERREIEDACERCGRLVCERHFDEGTGFCVVCARELGGAGKRHDPDDLPDDVDIYRV